MADVQHALGWLRHNSPSSNKLEKRILKVGATTEVGVSKNSLRAAKYQSLLR